MGKALHVRRIFSAIYPAFYLLCLKYVEQTRRTIMSKKIAKKTTKESAEKPEREDLPLWVRDCMFVGYSLLFIPPFIYYAFNM